MEWKEVGQVSSPQTYNQSIAHPVGRFPRAETIDCPDALPGIPQIAERRQSARAGWVVRLGLSIGGL